MDQTLAVEVGAHAGTVEEIGGPLLDHASTYTTQHLLAAPLLNYDVGNAVPVEEQAGRAGTMTATWVRTLFPPSGDPERSLIPRGSALGHFGPTPFFSRYREWQSKRSMVRLARPHFPRPRNVLRRPSALRAGPETTTSGGSEFGPRHLVR